MKYKHISKYSSRDDVAEINGYHYGEKALQEYIEENYIELIDKPNEELQEIYKGVFQKAMNEFVKNFDYNKWREETIFWY